MLSTIIITTLINCTLFSVFFYFYNKKEIQNKEQFILELQEKQQAIITARERNKPYYDFLENEKKVYLFTQNEYNNGVLKGINLAIEKATITPDIDVKKEAEWFDTIIEELTISSDMTVSEYSKGFIYGLKIAKICFYKQINITD